MRRSENLAHLHDPAFRDRLQRRLGKGQGQEAVLPRRRSLGLAPHRIDEGGNLGRIGLDLAFEWKLEGAEAADHRREHGIGDAERAEKEIAAPLFGIGPKPLAAIAPAEASR